MKSLERVVDRSPEERMKFSCFMQKIVWAQGKTGRSYAEIISLVMRKGKMELERSCY